jgi:hypothetical protein
MKEESKRESSIDKFQHFPFKHIENSGDMKGRQGTTERGCGSSLTLPLVPNYLQICPKGVYSTTRNP